MNLILLLFRGYFNIMTKLQDVLDAVKVVDGKADAVSAKVDALVAGQGTPEDQQPAVDAVNALGAKLDAIQAK
jgi:hypothetical protein